MANENIGAGPSFLGHPDRMVNYAPDTSIVNSEEDPDKQREMESFYRSLEIEEERAKADPDFTRLLNAETPEDVAAVLDTFEEAKDFDFSEANDSYSERRLLAFGLKRARILGKSHKMLASERIVVKKDNRNAPGQINSDGYLDEKSSVRIPGYSIRVETEMEEVPVVKERTEEYTRNEQGARTGEIKVIEKKEIMRRRKERVYYGTDQERRVLGGANLEFVKQAITGEKTHNQYSLMWNMRAALEGMVKTFYTKEVLQSNTQIKWFFNAPDIREMSKNPENTTVGDLRDKTMRILEMLGNCESKEKLENFLNTTFHLEKILDTKTQNRVIGLMSKLGVVTKVEMKAFKQNKEETGKVSERYKKVVEFLVGKNIAITADGPGGSYRYELKDGWLTYEQRKSEGKDGVKKEGEVRGWLLKFGNPHVRERDVMNALLTRVALVVGDQDAVLEGDRRFYLWGGKDWYGLEVYDKEGIPTGEELQRKRNELTGTEWLDYGRMIKEKFAVGGEPVGTDIIKPLHTDWYRLKDALSHQGRPTGPYVTIGKFPHLANDLMGLGRSEVVVNGRKTIRNIREQWGGLKDKDLSVELPKNLGQIEWEKASTPQNVMEALLDETIEEIKWDKIQGVPQGLKDAIDSYKKGDKSKVQKVLSEVLGLKDEAIASGVEGFYWLMLFLTCDEDKIKRPWSFINNWLEDPSTLAVPDGLTKKVKFVEITQGAQGPYDGYIAAEKRARTKKGGAVDSVELAKSIKEETDTRIDKMLKDWYSGVRSDPLYPTWVNKKFEYKIYEFDHSGKGENSKAGVATWQEIVEGVDEKNPGLAVRYGFLDPNQINAPRRNRFRIIKGPFD